MAFKSSLLLIPFMLLMRQVDTTVPETQFYIYIAYAVSVGLTFAIYAYIYYVIQQKKERTVITVPPEAVPFAGPSTEPPKRMTIEEYDIAELYKSFTRSLTLVGISVFLVFQFRLVQPLLLQSLMGLNTLFASKIVIVHLMGYPAEGENARPWKADNPFGDLFNAVSGAGGSETPAAAPVVEGEAEGEEQRAIAAADAASSIGIDVKLNRGNSKTKKRSKKQSS